MHCPDCDTLLKAIPYNLCERCPRCAGEWYDLPALAHQLSPGGDTLEADAGRGSAFRRDDAPLAPPPAVESSRALRTRSSRRCPICRAVLRSRRWPSALPAHCVALCPLGHGAWLAVEEMRELKQAVERASVLLDSQRGYFTFLAASAERRFMRATRPGRPGGALRRFPLARLLS